MSIEQQIVTLVCPTCGKRHSVDNNSPVNRNHMKDEQLKRFYFIEGELVLCGDCVRQTLGKQGWKQVEGKYNPANMTALYGNQSKVIN